MKAFERAPHYLLDARLMIAWAKALEERGELDKARYVAARLKEFRNPEPAEFFARVRRPSAAARRSGRSSASAPAPNRRFADFR